MAVFSRRRPARVAVASGALLPYGDSTRNGALTASSTKVTRANAEQIRRLSLLPWQMDAFRYYNSVGECWYAAQFYARALSKVRLYAAIRDEQGEIEELPADSVPAEEWARVHDPGGGRSILQASYGRLMFLIGEAFLTVTEEKDEDGEASETWECLSPTELQVTDGQFVRYRGSGWNPRTYGMGDTFDPQPGSMTAWRLWQRHPEESIWADSPIRAVLCLFEELVILQLAVRAQATSRAAGSGILYVADELSIPTPTGTDDEDPQQDPFFKALAAGMTTPIKNPGDASAVVPIVVRGPYDYRDGINHVRLAEPMEKYPEEGLRSECIRRISLGLDMPPEVLLGMADSNHWTAWQIDEQTWSAHLDPVALRMAEDFADAYLRPACRAAGVENWQEIVLAVDPTDAINHPNRVADAKDLHDRGVISDEALRDAGGFNDADEPTANQRAFYEAVKLRQPVVTPEDVDMAQANEVDPGPPDPVMVEEGEQVLPEDLAASIAGAALFAVERSRELAGARLRARTRDCPECQEAINGVPNRLVAHTLGPDVVGRNGTPQALVAGGADVLHHLCVQWGYPHSAARRMAQLAESHAAKSLMRERPSPLPVGFNAYAER